jgi:hypothetical protein
MTVINLVYKCSTLFVDNNDIKSKKTTTRKTGVTYLYIFDNFRIVLSVLGHLVMYVSVSNEIDILHFNVCKLYNLAIQCISTVDTIFRIYVKW